ncbi:C6 finger domain [Mycena venus]|uniref:C6 finger domain n=1 Tax=Mycena venus TaxID=2733690 RepID=A0A8H7CJY7_9AGAR|nr:C6 finger domain [Mycena venus]
MASCSTPATALSLFIKRRRAFVACASCRKRKIKCVKTSSANYAPCTRCTLKGLKCEFYAVPEHYPSSQPHTTTEIELAPHDSYSDPGWTPPPMTCPSAGIDNHLGKNSFSAHTIPARRNSDPPTGSCPRYPYQRRHAPTNPRRRASQPRVKPTILQQSLPVAYPQESLHLPVQNHLGAVEPPYDPGLALYLALSNADGPFYGQYYEKEQSLGAKQRCWSQVM